MKNGNYNLDKEIIESMLEGEQVQDFVDDMNFVSKVLGENKPQPSDGFSDRVKAAVYTELESTTSSSIFFGYQLKKALALAAMLLVVFSLVFINMGPNKKVVDPDPGSGMLAKAEVSDNPFSQPDLLMEVLMEQQDVNVIDGMTLEAVSVMWGQEGQNDNENPSSQNPDKDDKYVV